MTQIIVFLIAMMASPILASTASHTHSGNLYGRDVHVVSRRDAHASPYVRLDAPTLESRDIAGDGATSGMVGLLPRTAQPDPFLKHLHKMAKNFAPQLMKGFDKGSKKKKNKKNNDRGEGGEGGLLGKMGGLGDVLRRSDSGRDETMILQKRDHASAVRLAHRDIVLLDQLVEEMSL